VTLHAVNDMLIACVSSMFTSRRRLQQNHHAARGAPNRSLIRDDNFAGQQSEKGNYAEAVRADPPDLGRSG
tara:strand:+ start:827 stop:1039 length:213 start_codon:yes stop_codon:yes gene_type:complete